MKKKRNKILLFLFILIFLFLIFLPDIKYKFSQSTYPSTVSISYEYPASSKNECEKIFNDKYSWLMDSLSNSKKPTKDNDFENDFEILVRSSNLGKSYSYRFDSETLSDNTDSFTYIPQDIKFPFFWKKGTCKTTSSSFSWSFPSREHIVKESFEYWIFNKRIN